MSLKGGLFLWGRKVFKGIVYTVSMSRCHLRELLDRGFRLVALARLGRVGINEALDDLWEVLVNIDYELQRLRSQHPTPAKAALPN
jgi:hypothetical protein